MIYPSLDSSNPIKKTKKLQKISDFLIFASDFCIYNLATMEPATIAQNSGTQRLSGASDFCKYASDFPATFR